MPELRASSLPATVSVSVPEGFAYYALHPLDYAEAAARLPLVLRSEPAVVVGIRSIGTTLSAVARAALAVRGVNARRLTVRPTGHPWERVVRFSPEEQGVVKEGHKNGARFLVLDEGPGLSGSSFLATAEALEALGVARERITLVGSHAAEPARLCARDAQQRWARFAFVAVAPPARVPPGADVSGGEWRRHLFQRDEDWPASWTQFERRKVLSRDSGTIFKFEGIGPYGEAPLARARVLAELGFGPRVERAQHGFAAYEFVAGRRMRAAELDAEMVRRLAAYCATRAREFPADAGAGAVEQLVEVNWREGLGGEMAVPELRVERGVIVDGKMHPHEWVRGADGRVLKTDGVNHGDDHFFPGPTDIAWDLTGAMVEWEMTESAAEAFLEEYRRMSGDDASDRVAGWKSAYTLFRLGYSKMAAEAMAGSAEETRLRRDVERYRAATRSLAVAGVSAVG